MRGVAAIAEGPCWVCGGLTGRYDDLAALVARKLDPWEFETFRIGSKIDFEMAGREESLWGELSLTAPEPLKAEVNREVGKRVSDIVRKEAALDSPDVVAVMPTGGTSVGLPSQYLTGMAIRNRASAVIPSNSATARKMRIMRR